MVQVIKNVDGASAAMHHDGRADLPAQKLLIHRIGGQPQAVDKGLDLRGDRPEIRRRPQKNGVGLLCQGDPVIDRVARDNAACIGILESGVTCLAASDGDAPYLDELRFPAHFG